MAKKILQEEFEQRIKEHFPDASFKIIEYTAISKPCKIQCLKCNKIKIYSKASNVLKWNFCCENQSRLDLAKQQIDRFPDFVFIKKDNNDNLIIRHTKCGKEFKRKISSVINNANHCLYCDENTGLALSFDKAANQIKAEFGDSIKLLEYNAIRTKNTYKCMKCGLIFNQTQKNLLASRGCPKCDRFKSKGEKKIANYLKENNIFFKEQVSFPNLSNGKQKFDFVVYKDNECTQIDYIIECQGEQHRKNKENIFESLEIIQERDQRKKDFCKKYNYSLYEIIYEDGKLLNLDILPIKTKFNDYPR